MEGVRRILGSLLSVMPSFREIRDLLPLSHGSNIISEQELLVLHEEYQPANLTFPQSSYGEFHLKLMTLKTMNVW